MLVWPALILVGVFTVSKLKSWIVTEMRPIFKNSSVAVVCLPLKAYSGDFLILTFYFCSFNTAFVLASTIQFVCSCSLVTLLRVVCFWVASSCENNVIMNSPVKLLLYWQGPLFYFIWDERFTFWEAKKSICCFLCLYPHKLFLAVLVQGILKILLLFNCF